MPKGEGCCAGAEGFLQNKVSWPTWSGLGSEETTQAPEHQAQAARLRVFACSSGCSFFLVLGLSGTYSVPSSSTKIYPVLLCCPDTIPANI